MLLSNHPIFTQLTNYQVLLTQTPKYSLNLFPLFHLPLCLCIPTKLVSPYLIHPTCSVHLPHGEHHYILKIPVDYINILL